jgi:2'-5' RNA ligase
VRLFVAVWPPPEVLDLVAEIDRPALAGVRWTTRDQWHVTLRFLGRMDGIDAAGARLAEAAAAVRGSRGVGSVEPVGQGRPAGSLESLGSVASAAGGSVASAGVVASAGPLTRCLGRSIVMLPVGGLDDLATTVVRLTASIGEPPPSRPFTGHLTLARGKPGIKVQSLAGVAVSATWPVSEVTLVESELRPHGARYEIVARFPLG